MYLCEIAASKEHTLTKEERETIKMFRKTYNPTVRSQHFTSAYLPN